jgi:hypothetical protein
MENTRAKREPSIKFFQLRHRIRCRFRFQFDEKRGFEALLIVRMLKNGKAGCHMDNGSEKVMFSRHMFELTKKSMDIPLY